MFPIEILHVIACLALAGAALFRRMRHGNQAGAHLFLFPYVLAVGFSAILIIAAVAAMIVPVFGWAFVKLHLADPGVLPYAGRAALMFLPVAGIFPTIGKKPLLMAFLGLMPLLPWIHYFAFQSRGR